MENQSLDSWTGINPWLSVLGLGSVLDCWECRAGTIPAAAAEARSPAGAGACALVEELLGAARQDLWAGAGIWSGGVGILGGVSLPSGKFLVQLKEGAVWGWILWQGDGGEEADLCPGKRT